VRLLVEADTGSTVENLQQIIGRLERPIGALLLLGKALEDYERDEFATSGHGQWQADEPVTQKLKHSGRVLIDTGHLMDQLTRAHIDGDDVYLDAGDADYARFQSRRRNPVPAPALSTIGRWGDQAGNYLVTGRA
jgi:hypothetical protein